MVDGGRGLVMAEWDGFLRAMWRLYQKASGGGVCTLHVLHWLEGWKRESGEGGEEEYSKQGSTSTEHGISSKIMQYVCM